MDGSLGEARGLLALSNSAAHLVPSRFSARGGEIFILIARMKRRRDDRSVPLGSRDVLMVVI